MNTRNLRLVPPSQEPTPASSQAIGEDLLLALSEFDLVDQHLQSGNFENQVPRSSFLQSNSTPFPEINPSLLESNLPDEPLSTSQIEVEVAIEMDHITVSFVTEVEKILANSQLHDIEMSMKEYAKALFLIHTTYDLRIMPKEKRLELLLEIKTLLGHLPSDDDKARYIAFFDSKDFKKDLGIVEKEKLIKLARDTFRMYFQSKKKYEELLEITKRQQQEEQERLRQETEAKRLQEDARKSEEARKDEEARLRMVNNLASLEIELGVDNKTWNKQQQEEERKAEEARKALDAKKTEETRRLEQLKGVEMARTHTEKFAKRRAERLSQLSSQPLSKSDEK